MNKRYRVFFVSDNMTNTVPFHLSKNNRDKADPPSTTFFGEERYDVSSTTTRAGIRRHGLRDAVNKRRKTSPKYQIDSETLRIFGIGGVKGKDASIVPTPQQIQTVREKAPLLEVFGMGDPFMFGGTLFMGAMISKNAVVRGKDGKPDPMTTIPFVRRSLLTDNTFSLDEISDPQTMKDQAIFNRKRSQIEQAIDTWRKAETNKRKAAPVMAREIDKQKVILLQETGKEFRTPDDAKTELDRIEAEGTALGFKTVSELMPLVIAVAPAGTPFDHRIVLNNTSLIGIGAFMSAWSNKNLFDPIMGGNAARGAGGLFRGSYDVFVQDDDGKMIPDCRIHINPYEPITIDNVVGDILTTAMKAWAEADITEYCYTFKDLMKLIS
jgi:hypothetical protein